MRIPSFLPGFTSITKERSQGDPELLSNGTGTKLRELVLDILPRFVLGYAKILVSPYCTFVSGTTTRYLHIP